VRISQGQTKLQAIPVYTCVPRYLGITTGALTTRSWGEPRCWPPALGIYSKVSYVLAALTYLRTCTRRGMLSPSCQPYQNVRRRLLVVGKMPPILPGSKPQHLATRDGQEARLLAGLDSAVNQQTLSTPPAGTILDGPDRVGKRARRKLTAHRTSSSMHVSAQAAGGASSHRESPVMSTCE